MTLWRLFNDSLKTLEYSLRSIQELFNDSLITFTTIFSIYSNLNKRLSISTVCISSGSQNNESDCLTDGSVAERIKNFMSKTQVNNSSPVGNKPLMRVRPRRSMQDLSIQNNNNKESCLPLTEKNVLFLGKYITLKSWGNLCLKTQMHKHRN